MKSIECAGCKGDGFVPTDDAAHPGEQVRCPACDGLGDVEVAPIGCGPRRALTLALRDLDEADDVDGAEAAVRAAEKALAQLRQSALLKLVERAA